VSDVAIDRPDLRMTVIDALDALPRRAKAVVVLRYLEDYSIAQTAEILSCSEGTVKAQSSRALMLLRQRLGNSFHELIEH
jgi:RNA polymerase sigma factor (sigma-70 family)